MTAEVKAEETQMKDTAAKVKSEETQTRDVAAEVKSEEAQERETTTEVKSEKARKRDLTAEDKSEGTQKAETVVPQKEKPIKDNKAEKKVAGMANGTQKLDAVVSSRDETVKDKKAEEKVAGMVNGVQETEAVISSKEEPIKDNKANEKVAGMTNGGKKPDAVVSSKEEPVKDNKAEKKVAGMANGVQNAEAVVSSKEEPVKDKKAEEKVVGMANGAQKTEAVVSSKEEPVKDNKAQEKVAGMANGAQNAEAVVSAKEDPVKYNKAEEKVAEMANGSQNAEADFSLKKDPVKDNKAEEKVTGMANGTQNAAVVSSKEDPVKDNKAKEKVAGMVDGTVEKKKATADDVESKKLEEPKKGEDDKIVERDYRSSSLVLKTDSFKEESTLLSDLKEHEKKALAELAAKLEETILGNTMFRKEEQKIEEKAVGETSDKEEKSRKVVEEKSVEGKTEQKEGAKKAEEGKSEKNEQIKSSEEEKPVKKDEAKPPEAAAPEAKEKCAQEGGEKEKQGSEAIARAVEVDENISLWGVSLLPSKGEDSTNIVLLKFLRAREFRVNDAFEMLTNTLQWRKEFKTDTILDEEFDAELSSMSYLKGVDREGHPICYNIHGIFENEKLYQKTFGTEEKREKFLRWRVQEMEKSIQQLNFEPGGVCSILQINDLKDTPGPSKRDLRLATKQAVAVLQDNYPEFVARNIFINVPFWYYAFNAIMSPFLTQRTRSKFVFARPSRVTETLLRYIPAEDIPLCYGGLKRENDTEFAYEISGVSECFVKSGGTETIEIAAPEVGTTLLWDLTVIGWDVYYKEQFVPTDEGSYTLIVKKGKKKGACDEPIRNSFKNKEPGKLVLTIQNSTFKKKRVLYRYKEVKSGCP